MFLIYYDNYNRSESIIFLGLTQTKEDADKVVSLYAEKINYRYEIKCQALSILYSDQIKRMCEKRDIASKAKEKLTEEEYESLIEEYNSRL